MDWRRRGAIAGAAIAVLAASQLVFVSIASSATKATTVQGTLHVRVGAQPKPPKHTDPLYALTLADGSEVALQPRPAVEETMRTFAERGVEVTGTRTAKGITVTGIRPVTAAAEAAAAAGPRTWKLAVLLVNFQNDRSQPYTAAQIRDSVLTGARSAARYWNESTGGTVTMTGDVFGWFTLPVNSTSCNLGDWMQRAKSAATSAGKNMAAYDHFQIWFPYTAACGSWSGMGELNGPHTWIQNPPGWGADRFWAWSAHELGHNLNLNHSTTLKCGNVALKPVSTQCSLDEYGDPFDVMGAGWLDGRLTNNIHKQELGVATTVETTGGTHTLAPASPYNAAATQAIRVPRPDGSSLWLEYRRPFGTFDNFSAGDARFNGVFVRLGTIDPNGRWVSSLLDMTPDGNFDHAVLGPGKSFTDPLPGGTTITVNSVSATGASITLSTPMSASVSAGNLSVIAGPGVHDNVSIVRSGTTNRYTVTNTAAPIAPGAGCTALTKNQVSCTGVTKVTVNTKNGNDTVSVNAGNHSVNVKGKGGKDTLESLGSGPARLHGGGGNDVIRGGSGKDVLIGGPGADTIWSRDGAADNVKCKAGNDTVNADRNDNLIDCEVVRY